MPGKVKVKVLAGRNLPVMDRSSDTTDAFVEIKLGGITHKTDVCRKSLNPQWNSDWYRFEMDDAELQDEPLQIRLMDYDTYSANDAIGKVHPICLNPMLIPGAAIDPSGQSGHGHGKGSVMSGWFPVYDTMHGIRGEVNLIIKVDLFSDVNKFRQSSCGVQFFHSPNIPHGYHAPAIHGFVEELVVNDDPEYQWIDKIRTPRASNEARQVVFLKLSGEVQRKIGLKALDMGANAVIGYKLCLDLEGDVGVVARGIGTAVTLIKIPDAPQQVADSALIEENEAASSSGGANPASPGAKVTTGHTRAESTGSRMTQSPAKSGAAAVPSSTCKDSGIYRRSSDSDLSVTPKGNSLTSCERGTPAVTRVVGATMKSANADNLDMLEYPFLTLDKYPPGFIIHLGSAVCSRSVKLLERVPNPDEPECRDSWWTELRMEIRSHARALGCNVVLGYLETTTITEDVCVLSATGTAALINFPYSSEQPVRMTSSLDRVEFEKDVKEGIKELKIAGSTAKIIEGVATKPIEEVPEGGSDKEAPPAACPPSASTSLACALLHLPYAANSVPFSVTLDTCAVCRRAKVPNVFLATIEIPDGLQITGRGCLVQAQVCRQKRDLKGESNAKEISDGLPFLEYELYRVLINKMKVKGMNAIFGLKCSIAVGEKMMTIVATGTAVYLSALPAAALPKIVGAERAGSNPEKLNEIQRTLQDTIEKNREIYQLKTFGDVDPRPLSESEESDDELAEMDLNVGNKDACILEVDDIEDLEVISLLMEPCPPEGFHVVNTQTVPGLLDLEVVRNLQYFAQVWRGHINQQTHLAKNLQRLLQCIYYKLRSMIPCAICDLRFTIDLPEADWIQVLVTGMALGLGEPSKMIKNKRRLLSNSASKEGIKKGEEELIFNLEEDHVFETVTSAAAGVSQSLTHTPTTHNPPTQFAQTGSLKLRNKSPTRGKAPTRLSRHMPVRERYGVDVTPLSYVPGGRIEKYLGNLNFFFIRESTSIRENGGICGFVHGFVTELLAVVRAHVTALGGNAMVSFYMTELLLNESVHKNQGQSLISVGGDVVFVSYYTDE
ncbi:C2 domain-containing protein 5 [Lutzomyia longipalpis]|uniref:C2 domain-containing protein 5 n=1 Tax=Lutzomyia longipalpis TaxID=7200 RepID=UPI0024834F21|nr:C2 domain-containing protein 5 [Lutzomyia longipalpis]